MKILLQRSLLLLVALAVLAYFGDYLSFRFRIPGNRAPFGTVHVQPYLAVPQKNGKTEFILDDPTDQPCSNSLFPQGGAPPCWYLRRHASKRVNL